MTLELILLALLVLVINGLVFWLYYARTKRMIFKIRDSDHDSFKTLLYRMEHRLAKPLPYWSRKEHARNVWAVVFTFERPDLLQRTLASIRRHEPELKILVVDNGSKDSTPSLLASLLQQGHVNKVLANTHADVPQWQKSFALHQAVNLLSIEPVTHLVFFDDDVEVRSPFLEFAFRTLNELESRGVRVVSLMHDAKQDTVHETLETLTIDGQRVKLKRTFNGAMMFMPMTSLDEFGLPPIAEGADEIGAEDWYFSRRLIALEGYAACADLADHLGVTLSQRELKNPI